MNAPKVSVIVPVYNVEKYIGKCLDSILAQTMKEIEIICVDDCSKDNSIVQVEKYARKDARVKILHHKTNQGLSAARNTGIKKAAGEYILFVDSDDYIDEHMVEEMYDKAERTDSDVVISNINLFFNDTEETQVFRNSLFYGFLSGRTFKAKEYPDIIVSIAAWDKLYKSELLKKNGIWFPEGLIYEDHIFTVQVLALAKRISVINKPFYYYRKNTGISITDKERQNDKYKFDYLEMCRRAKMFLKEHDMYEDFQKSYLKYQFMQAEYHQRNIANYQSFKKYFDEMRAITSPSDIECLREMPLSYPLEQYLRAIENENCNLYYPASVAFSHFCRYNGYLCYISRKGKMWRIMKLKARRTEE